LRQHKLRQPRGESGFALILALACLIVLGITVTAVIDYTTSGSRAASRSNNRDAAFLLAEAGIQNAYAVLNRWDPSTNTGNNASDPTVLGCDANGQNCHSVTSTYSNGTATWYGVYNTTTSTWTIYSTGSVQNQGTTSYSTKSITATVHITWNNTQPSNATAWNYAMAIGSGSTCDVTLSNSVAINAPLYVAGNLCFQNSSAVSEGSDAINMEVLGDLHWMNGATGGIGIPNPISTLKLGGQCISGTSGTRHTCVIHPNSGADPIYVKTGGFSTTTVQITAPTANFSSYYNSASPGPKNPCNNVTDTPVNSPTNAPTFDNDTSLNLGYTGAGVNGSAYSTSSPFNLTPSGSDYNCTTTDPYDGHVIGELKWNHSTNTLTVKGAIYIDGSVTISNSNIVQYNGSATLYITGVLTIPGTKFCASVSGSDCNFSGWDPNAEMFIVVANGTDNTSSPSSGNSITLGQGAHFQGGLFATNNITLSNSSQADGPMIANEIFPGNSVILKPLPVINTLPLGAPGNPNVHAVPGPIQYQNG
jgi:Tfp pilus assembly protein PilX